jgi:hypothetical protein
MNTHITLTVFMCACMKWQFFSMYLYHYSILRLYSDLFKYQQHCITIETACISKWITKVHYLYVELYVCNYRNVYLKSPAWPSIFMLNVVSCFQIMAYSHICSFECTFPHDCGILLNWYAIQFIAMGCNWNGVPVAVNGGEIEGKLPLSFRHCNTGLPVVTASYWLKIHIFTYMFYSIVMSHMVIFGKHMYFHFLLVCMCK